MGCLAGPQETATMWGEPVDEVVLVLGGLNALLHKQSEVTDGRVVATVPTQQKSREEGSDPDPQQSLGLSSTTVLPALPLPAIKPPH